MSRCWDEIVTAAADASARAPSGVATSSPGIPATTSSIGDNPATAASPSPDDPAPSRGPIAVVAHGGVIRSILSGMTKTPLIDSFKVFSLHYGCVIRVHPAAEGLGHTMLSNRAPAEKEQHKPSSFYNKSHL